LDKRYDKEYWKRLERSWKQWKGRQGNRKRTLETIREEKEEIKQKGSEIKEWMKEDEDKMGNIVDPYYKL